MGKWNIAEESGLCYNCDGKVFRGKFVASAGGWPVCETCADELDREYGDEDER